MAGGKETPRQKMIGMMYLVLTAMLALNVSKSILDAFITIDEQSLEQNSTLVKSINGIGSTISFRMQDPQSKKTATEINDVYQEVKIISNKADDFFNSEMNRLMGETEEEKNWFKKDEKTQIIDYKPLQEIGKKDDYDTPSRLFGGVEGKSKTDGMLLRQKLIDFRNELILTAADSVKDDKNIVHVFDETVLKDSSTFFSFLRNDKHPNMTDLMDIYNTLTKPEKLVQGEAKKEKAWNVAMFYHQPMVGVVSTMTSMRNDIRLAQEKASKMLLSRIDKPMMNINKVEAQVLASTQYINVGDKLDIKIGIVAFDSTKKYKAGYRSNAGGSYSIADSGQFTLSGGSPGKKTIDGYLEVELNGEVKQLPFDFEYTVGKPSATVAAPELNVMYRGYDNKIQAVASGFPPNEVKTNCDGCSSFTKNGDLWVARVGGGKTATVYVKAGGKTVGKQEFRIMPMPKPQPYFAGQTYGSKTIKKGLLKQTPPLKAKLADSPLNVQFSVKSFTLDVIVNGKIITEKGRGGTLTPKMKNLVKNAKKGQKVYFSDIMVAGPDGKAKPIGGLTFKVI
ncbi:MAG: GldM family protein [Flavobacteriales bacterium]